MIAAKSRGAFSFFEQLLANNAIAFWLVVISCSMIYCYSADFPIVSYDSFWHLKTGQDFLSAGKPLFYDHYSFTYPGTHISGSPYIFQLIFALVSFIVGDEYCHYVMRIFAYACLLVSYLFFHRMIHAGSSILLVSLPLIILFLQMRSLVRPELFDYCFVVTALILYIRGADSSSTKYYMAVVFFMLIWANYHAAIVGYIIFFGFYLDRGIGLLRLKAGWSLYLAWFFSGILLLGVGFINPSFEHALSILLQNSGLWVTNINEYAPLHKTDSFIKFVPLWLLSFFTSCYLWMRGKYGLGIVNIAFSVIAWLVMGFVTVFGVFLACMVAYSLTLFATSSEAVKIGLRVLLGLYTLVIGYLLVINMNYKSQQAISLPEGIVQYLNSKPEGGNIFNDYKVGGYLAYSLGPAYNIYIDGRSNILYPKLFVEEYFGLINQANHPKLEALINRYDVQYLVFPYTKKMLWLTLNVDSYGVEYIDRDFVLLSKKEANLSVAAFLYHFPMCWDSGLFPQLKSEAETGLRRLGSESALRPMLGDVAQLTKLDVGSLRHLLEAEKVKNWSSERRRFWAFVAFDLELYGDAINLFNSLLNKMEYLDYFMLIYSLMEAGKLKEAEYLLNQSDSSWPKLIGKNPTMNEKYILYSLYGHLEAVHGLSETSSTHIAALAKELSPSFHGTPRYKKNPIPKFYCDALIPIIGN
jgi:hypothetical protein